jgi:phage terminase large subunit GpA-like protein
VHLPTWADGEWLKQLTAEQLVTVKTRRGFTRLEWQKLRERNEALDTRVYARAAAWILGADRWPEARWADLEAQLEVAKQDGSEAGPAHRSGTGAVRPGTTDAAPAHGALERHAVIHGHGRRTPRPPRRADRAAVLGRGPGQP